MTVQELIEQLQTLPPDALVWREDTEWDALVVRRVRVTDVVTYRLTESGYSIKDEYRGVVFVS